jgi:stringent starvation protein B
MDPSEPTDQVLTSTKPYLVRAIYEWILDNGLTPHLLVDAQYPGTQVPTEFVQDGHRPQYLPHRGAEPGDRQ